MSKPKCVRVIEWLRLEYPNTQWVWDREDRQWKSLLFSVEARSLLTPKYDGDDESCETRYFRTDTGEQLFFGCNKLFES